MEDELIESDIPCSSLAVEHIVRLGTAGALWGLCSGPYDARKLGLTGFARTSFVARSVASFGIQCGFSAGVFSIICRVPLQFVFKPLNKRVFHSHNFTSTEIQILTCLANGSFCDAREFLIQVPQNTNRSPVIAWTSMLSRFLKEHLINEAQTLFNIIPEKNLVTYNTMLSGYIQSGRITEALTLFVSMQEKNVISYTSMLHGLMSSGMVEEGKKLFKVMPERNIITWNSMLSGLTKNNDFEEARYVFDQMPVKNLVSWIILISGYCRTADVDKAYELFKKIPEKDVDCWIAMISGFTWNKFYRRAILLFLEMRSCVYIKPNQDIFISLVYACAGFGFPKFALQLHAQLIVYGWEYLHHDILIYMYTKLSMMDYARYFFVKSLRNRTLKSCNLLISGYANEGKLEEAQYIFDIAPFCDKVSWTSMVSGYFSIGNVEKACELFDNMPERDSIAWTALISGHVQNELFLEAKLFFSEMRINGFLPLQATYSCLLGAAGAVSDIDEGRKLHCLLLKSELYMDMILENAIISMYAKCGEVENAYSVFSEMSYRDLVSWSSMLMGYSNHSMVNEALMLFKAMIRSGVNPDSVTFLSLLYACSNAGLVEQGLIFFKSMSEVYSIKPDIQHCVSIVNLLGRAGRIEEAEQFVLRLESEQGVEVWGALLGMCRLNDMNDEINNMVAKRACNYLLKLDPDNTPAHVVLCNMLVSIGKYEDEGIFRKEMRVKGMKKIPGQSWVSNRGQLYSFFSN